MLVVDDSAFARHRLAQALTEAGYDVLEADGAAAALQALAETPPDAVALDLLMPDMNGIDLLRLIRVSHPSLPVIVVTADVQKLTREEAMEAGASAVVGKTEGPRGLLLELRRLAGESDALALSGAEYDALVELMNVATGQAANALASLLERRVLLSVPRVELMDPDGLAAFLSANVEVAGAAVLQEFSGGATGRACLIFPLDHARTLVRELLGVERGLERLTAEEVGALSEVGNVVLNAVVCMIGDQIRLRLGMQAPTVLLRRSGSALAALLTGAVPDSARALVLVSRLNVGGSEVIAYLTLLLPRSDVLRILRSLLV
ncbi:MAG: response regulator [Armatimonadota bacterium]|nr:response regulator [Armatimonadota bacterium]